VGLYHHRCWSSLPVYGCRGPSAPLPGGLPGARDTWVQTAVPLLPWCPREEGAFPPPPPSARTLPPKPLNNGPFLPCLGMETGTKALRGSGNAGGGAQAPSAWEARGKEGHAQPVLPDTAPSVLPCAGWEPGRRRQPTAPPWPRRQGIQRDLLLVGRVRAHLPL